MMKTQIVKITGKTDITTLYSPAFSEHCLTVNGSNSAEMDSLIRASASSLKADVMGRFVFAGTEHYKKFIESVKAPDGNISWLQGDACKDGKITSMQAFAVNGGDLKILNVKSRKTGFLYEDADARYCRLCGMMPQNPGAPKPEQAAELFESISDALNACGFKFTDTVRTWFYIDKVLTWYKEFNAVRTAFFEKMDIFSRMVPASTGIGASNQNGAALLCDLLAVQPKTDKARIYSVPSPMQGSALNYKSSFSRAVEMSFPAYSRLFISGTASIDSDGNTAYLGDCARQIDLTMRVVEAILHSRKMDWHDLVRGIAYFKDFNDKHLFDEYCEKHEIPRFPLALAHADICRGDLLFELEADAVKVF
ncbi:MAG: hypothetical protein A2017_09530 [Lentisphaerae bacterium GWF2_44_16]|nr:MAG: hypothetical protein A2017_09530 [Lentisphaerae bacterium GWF2_44_16]